MTKSTREQVVQWAQATWPSDRAKWCVDGDLPKLEQFATLARADLEAKVAEQTAEIDQLLGILAEARDAAGPWYEYAEAMSDPAEVVGKIKRLSQQLAESQTDAARWKDDFERTEVNIRILLGLLVASQVREKELRDAITSVCCDPDGNVVCFQNQADNLVLQDALSTPSDDTALREYCAEMVEKISTSFTGVT